MKKIPFLSSIFSKKNEKTPSKNRTLNLIDDERQKLLPTAYKEWEAQGWDLHGEDLSGATVSALIAENGSKTRSRHEIYQQWRKMESDPIISIALKTHVTAALGGHETSGQLIFIEDKPDAIEADKKLLDEIRIDLLEQLNDIAFSICYNGVAFGDAFARTYFEKGKGLVHCVVDEMTHPVLIVPYEKGGKTIGYLAGTNQSQMARLNTFQLARFKMPRVAFVPQMGVLSKAYRLNIMEDILTDLPAVPAMVGGSLLFAAEKPFNNLYMSMNAIVGQRWVDSIDESIMTFNLTGGTKEQQKKFKENIKQTLLRSKELADKAMNGEPHFGRVRHVLFTHQEKQAAMLGESLGSRRQGSVSIDDIMLHARLLAGSLGIDLSMLGFADQLSGGLGDGGFFRSSSQIGEWTRIIRVAFSRFVENLIDQHMLFKYGKKWEKGKRPFSVNFYGSISAFEAEKQKTRADAVGSAGLIAQTLAQLGELGFGEKEIVLFLSKQMLLDEDEAKQYAQALCKKTETADESFGTEES